MSSIIKKYTIDSHFKEKALRWAAANYEHYCFLNYTENDISYSHYAPFPCLLALGAKHTISTDTFVLEKLRSQLANSSNTYFGYIGYDVKNEIEKLESNNPSTLQFPASFFFSPIYTLEFQGSEVIIKGDSPDALIESIQSFQVESKKIIQHCQIQHKVSKEEYVHNVNKIKNHIVEGDVYELNYCIEFFAESVTELDTTETFLQLMKVSPSPFAVVFKNKEQYILSSSPERFLKKEGNTLIAQPMKGTSKRGVTPEQDQLLKVQLRSSEKEQAENMMIVDLMRNDLARSSKAGSVKVSELFGVYSLATVHQMISTIKSEVRPEVDTIDTIRNAFPMGSMTGAPKIRAMELIDKIENSKRAVFSGAFGYFTPEGNFDFNVLIRSLYYDSKKQHLNYWAGSAITFDSDPEKEYEECLLKASVITKVLEG